LLLPFRAGTGFPVPLSFTVPAEAALVLFGVRFLCGGDDEDDGWVEGSKERWWLLRAAPSSVPPPQLPPPPLLVTGERGVVWS